MIKPFEVHLWQSSLMMSPEEEQLFLSYLSMDEITRADRFRFPLHRQRFIKARGVLRKILSGYLRILPQDIVFSYSARGKPFVKDSDIEFNTSHSHDMAVYAVTKNVSIGVDVEKVEKEFDEAVAKRFFSEVEYSEFLTLPADERIVGFYRIWSRKEALIKVSGEGFAFALGSFSVPVAESLVPFEIEFNGESGWWLQSFVVAGYQAAFATRQRVEKVSMFMYG